MIDFNKIYFGCSDANTEAERNPSTFNKVFFDPHGHLKELISGDKFILRGRKGDGKTAYGAQLKLVGSEYDTYVYQRSLDNFNNTVFAEIKTYDNLGGNPYISFWRCILLIECVGMIYKYQPNIQTAGFVNIVDALSRYGFLATDNDISVTVTKLVEANSVLSLKDVFQHSRKYSREIELRGAEQIYTAIRNSIQNTYLTKHFLLVIDGLDDILNSTEFKAEIITGLIRAVEDINRAFKNTTLSIKTIVLIRDDILNLCRDPNQSKIVRDSGIRLSWTIQDIKELLEAAELIAKAHQAGDALGLTQEELAFYDALTRPQAIKDFYENETLVAMTRELTEMLRKNRTIDWQKKETARATMRKMVKRLLKKYKYPPDQYEDAIDTVISQCEMWTDNSDY